AGAVAGAGGHLTDAVAAGGRAGGAGAVQAAGALAVAAADASAAGGRFGGAVPTWVGAVRDGRAATELARQVAGVAGLGAGGPAAEAVGAVAGGALPGAGTGRALGPLGLAGPDLAHEARLAVGVTGADRPARAAGAGVRGAAARGAGLAHAVAVAGAVGRLEGARAPARLTLHAG